MRQSTVEEIQESTDLVLSVREKIKGLLQSGRKVHVIWDFDGVLADSRSDDVFALGGFDIRAYFAHEERLLFQTPDKGPWLMPIAHNVGTAPHFPPERFTQDLVPARCRIILASLKSDPDYFVFCVDDSAKHIEAFRSASAEEHMEDRTTGIVSPV